MELREEHRQRELLSGSSRVFGLAPNIEATYVANAKAIDIVPQAVGSDFLLFASSFYLAI